MPSKSALLQYQAMPLSSKIVMTKNRIREWYDYFDGNVCVSFSGGKDSTVLANLVRQLYSDVPLVFSNTGLEYPEIQSFARKMGAEFIRPKMMFSEVISTYGYPIISKEVSEAIYYARRINRFDEEYRKSIKQGEKTTEYFQRMLNGVPGIGKNGEVYDYRKTRSEQTIKRFELFGRYVEGSREKTFDKAEEIADLDIKDEGKLQSNSPFNKKKWLPLCRDTQFKISHYCCSVMKKQPLGKYQRQTGRKPYLGTLAEESRMRTQAWIKNGCNTYEGKKKTSQPMSFWKEQDVLHYIKQNGIEIASVYGDIVSVDDSGYTYEPILGIDCKLKCTGCERTGCIFCGFGVHLDKEPRFVRLSKTHPKQYEYCLGGGQWVDNPDYDPVAPKMDGDWQNWNPKKIWVPSKQGLGMKKVFDDCNQIYGKDFIKYE